MNPELLSGELKQLREAELRAAMKNKAKEKGGQVPLPKLAKYLVI